VTKKEIGAAFSSLVPEGTVVKVDKAKKELVIRTDDGEKALQITSNTKGLENAKEGARVVVMFSKKGDQLEATEISASEAGPRTAPQAEREPVPPTTPR